MIIASRNIRFDVKLEEWKHLQVRIATQLNPEVTCRYAIVSAPFE